MASAVTALLAALYRNLIWDEASFDATLAEEGSIYVDAPEEPSNAQPHSSTPPINDEPTSRRRRSVRFAPEPERHSERSRPQSQGDGLGQEGLGTVQEHEQRTGNLDPSPQQVERTRRKLKRSTRRGERQLALMRAELALMKAQEASEAQRQALKANKRAANWAAEKAANGSVSRAAVEAAWTTEQQRRVDASRVHTKPTIKHGSKPGQLYTQHVWLHCPIRISDAQRRCSYVHDVARALLLAQRDHHVREMAARREVRSTDERRKGMGASEKREKRERGTVRATTGASEEMVSASPPTNSRDDHAQTTVSAADTAM